MKSSPIKIQRHRLSDQVIENLIAMITHGQLQPGDKLPPEPELMKQFGVGRSSIREAIGALELIGLLTVRPGDGTRITDSTDSIQHKAAGLALITIGAEKVHELVEARSELEQSIAMYAAERATASDIGDIKQRHDLLIQAREQGQSLITADLEFHASIARACHNSILMRFFSELHRPVLRWMEQKAKYDWGFDRVIEDHERIINAIESHDPPAARQAMQSHIQLAGEKLITALSDTEG